MSYESDHGAAAPSLGALVPTYLPEVPCTGLSRCPSFSCRAFNEGALPWEFSLSCALVLEFDEFVYRPTQEYAALEDVGRLEPVGDWVYIHE